MKKAILILKNKKTALQNITADFSSLEILEISNNNSFKELNYLPDTGIDPKIIFMENIKFPFDLEKTKDILENGITYRKPYTRHSITIFPQLVFTSTTNFDTSVIDNFNKYFEIR